MGYALGLCGSAPARVCRPATDLPSVSGGFSTQLQAVTDALGNPLAFALTDGQAADIPQAKKVVPERPVEALIVDKA